MKYHGWPMDAEAAYLDLLGKLSAANARIAELEEAVRRNGIKVSDPLGSLLSPHDITEPFQPTTLPESKQQK